MHTHRLNRLRIKPFLGYGLWSTLFRTKCMCMMIMMQGMIGAAVPRKMTRASLKQGIQEAHWTCWQKDHCHRERNSALDVALSPSLSSVIRCYWSHDTGSTGSGSFGAAPASPGRGSLDTGGRTVLQQPPRPSPLAPPAPAKANTLVSSTPLEPF